MKKQLLFLTFVLVLALSAFALPVAAAEVWDGSTSEYLTPVDPSQDYNAETNPLAIRSGADLNYLQKQINEYYAANRSIKYKVNDEIKEIAGATSSGAGYLNYKQTADILLNDETYVMDEASGIIIVSDGTHTGYLGSGMKGMVYNTETAPVYNTWYTASSLTGTLEVVSTKIEEGYEGAINPMKTIAWGGTRGINSTEFKGNFDGGGYEIRGFFFENAGDHNNMGGLFGMVTANGNVKNVNLIGACSMAGATSRQAGLLISEMRTNGTVSNCFASGIIIGQKAFSSASIRILVGGLIGSMAFSKVENCGFVGYAAGPDSVVGGFAGSLANNANYTVTNCYHIGTVATENGNNVYGFAGTTGCKLVNCYSVGEVYSGNKNRYALTGSSNQTNCFYSSVAPINNVGTAVEKDVSEITAALMGDAFEDDTTGVNYGLPTLKNINGKATTAATLQTIPSRSVLKLSEKGVTGKEVSLSFDPRSYFNYNGSGTLTYTCDTVIDAVTGAAVTNASIQQETDGSYTVKVTPADENTLVFKVPVTAGDGSATAKAEVGITVPVNKKPTFPQEKIGDERTGLTGHTISIGLHLFQDPDGDSLTYEYALSEDDGATWSDYEQTSMAGAHNFTMSTPGEYLFKFRAYDGYEYSTAEPTQKVILTQNHAPQFAAGVTATSKAKTPTGVGFTINPDDYFTDPDNERLSYVITVDPGTADEKVTNIGSAMAQKSFTYRSYETGVHTVKIVANDSAVDSPAHTITLTVNKYGYNSDVWNGAVDVTWYDPYVDEFTLTKPAQLAGLAAITAGVVPTIPKDDFEDRTIYLGSDICLNDAAFVMDEESLCLKVTKADKTVYLGTGMTGKVDGADYTSTLATAYEAPKGATLAVTANDSQITYGNSLALNHWGIPIGNNNANAFRGTFDGQGHAISGLFTGAERANNLKRQYGLFGYNYGTVKNVTVDGAVLASMYAAGVVAYNYGAVESCANNADVISYQAYVGGVIAYNQSNADISHLTNSGWICGTGYTGGCVGYLASTNNISIKATRLTNYGNVAVGQGNSNYYFGGVVGHLQSGANATLELSECANYGSVGEVTKAGNTYCGGIVGAVAGGQNGSAILRDSYNVGTVCGNGRSGGIAAAMNGSKQSWGNPPPKMLAECYNCYNAGEVRQNDAGEKVAYGSAFGYKGVADCNIIKDVYYLDSTYPYEPVVTDENVIAKTAEEMKSGDFLEVLGEAFALDNDNVNDGFPILSGTSSLSSDKDILDFTINDVTGEVDDHDVVLNDLAVEAEGDTLTLAPSITVSPGATVVPASGEEATFVQSEDDPSVYTAKYRVTAADKSRRVYTVTLNTKANVASVKVDPAEVTVIVGFEGHTLTTAVQPVNANERGVIWMSANDKIATVDDDGTVKGVAVGETTIIATTVDGNKTAICKVTVAPFVDVTGITLPATASVIKTEKITLTPTFTPENASNTHLSWKSEDETIATVDENGVVTGVKEGETDITATSVDGGYTATCKVTVESVRVEGVAITQVRNLGIGDSKPLTATITPDTATVQDVVWTSDKPAVAAVDENGVVTGKAAGEAVITATAVDNAEISASTTVTVSATPYDVQWGGVYSRPYNNGNADVLLPYDPTKTREVWANGVGNGSPVVLDDYVYTYMAAVGMGGFPIAGTPGTFYKLDRETGKVVDSIPDCPGIGGFYYSYAAYGNGLIYVSGGSTMMAFDPDAMEMLWYSQEARLDMYGPVQYIAGKVVCNGNVFDAVTGELLAKLEGKYNWSNGAEVGNYFYVADYVGKIYAFNTKTWAVHDSYEFKKNGEILQPGVAYLPDKNRLYWGNAMGANINSVAIDPLTGKFVPKSLITTQTQYTTTCTPVVYGDRVYLAGQSAVIGGVIGVFDADTLEEIYTARGAREKIQGTPILYHDEGSETTYVYAQDYVTSALMVLKDTSDKTSGQLEQVTTLSHPNYAFEQMACDKDGAIYVSADSGYLHKFERSKADRPQFETDLSADRINIKLNEAAEPLAVNATVTDGGTVTYQWQKSADNVEWTDVENATAASYTPSTEAEGLTYYRVKATNTTADGSVEAISQVTPFNVFDGADYITVSFRLIGCTKSEGDVDFADEPGDYKGAEYQNWMKTKEYTISNGSTAKELIQIVFEEKGIKAVGVENNYIRAITGPEVLGGVTMEEFTNGQNSGWMYTVNGKHVDAINLVTLNDGDKVIMHYVNDYKYEDESTNPASAYLDKWLEVPDVEPEEQLPAYTTAKAVIDAIDGIGEVTLDSEEAIIAAREAFDALSDEAKALVNNEDTLKAAEEKLAELKEAKAEADKKAAKAVADAIDALPATVTAADKEAVAAAKAAYDALTEDQKALVSEEAKAKLDAAVAVIAAADDKAAADAVQKAISALPAADKLTANDKEAVDKAKAAYDALTDAQKALVPEATKKALDEAVAAVKKAVDDKTAADAVKDAINALPATDKLTADDKAAVEKARADYDKLSDAQKALVGDDAAKKLADAEAKIKELEPKPQPKPQFVDVPDNAYFKEAVDWAVSHEPVITTGTDATHFTPNGDCTRGQVVTFLWRAAGTPEPTSTTNPFVDVPANQYYYKAVLWAVEKGITTGTDKTHFTPNGKCTRGQVVTFLWRANGSPEVDANVSFSDVKTGAYYEKAVKWAVANKITEGTGAGKFSPDATCTRAQVVTFLFRAQK